MTYNKLIQFLFTQCPEIVSAMKNSNHHYDEANGILNPYHLEGDVLTHTMMVVQQSEFRKMPEAIMYASLFHDFGKPYCREENHESKRVSFYNHDAYSAFKSLKYMDMLNLDDIMKIRLFKVIALHTEIYKCKESDINSFAKKFRHDIQLIEDLRDLGICDGLGRFTDDSVSPRIDGVDKLVTFANKIIEEIKSLPKEKEKTLEAVILCGLPMSGKSTYKNSFIEKNPDYVVLSRDEVIMELGNGLPYNEAYRTVSHEEVDSIFNQRIQTNIKNKKNILFDMTSLSKKSRRRLMGSISKDYKKICKVFLCDLDTLNSRNEKRKIVEGKFIKEEVIEGMIKSFYPPLFDEFESIEYFTSK